MLTYFDTGSELSCIAYSHFAMFINSHITHRIFQGIFQIGNVTFAPACHSLNVIGFGLWLGLGLGICLYLGFVVMGSGSMLSTALI